MNQLAEETGIKKSSLYYIFENEDRLLKTNVSNMISICKSIKIENNTDADIFKFLIDSTIEKMLDEHPDAKKFITENQVALCQLTKKDLDTLTLMIQSMIKANKVENESKNKNTDD